VVGNDTEILIWAKPDTLADLPQTEEIYLEENYRSTASIIATAVDLISQGILLS
jgi:superfamily I DNA/RNA helicase